MRSKSAKVFTRFCATQVITGGKGVAGINTDADAGFVLHAVNNGGQVFKLKAEVAALAGGIFNDCGHAFGFSQRNINGLGNTRQALVFRYLLQVAAGMEIEQRQSELLAAAQFINKGIARFFQRFLNRVAEVNQVAVVRQDLSGTKAVFSQAALNSAIVSSLSGAARHCRWFLVNSAKAVASISAARMAALASPPEALTCAPMYFIKAPVKPLGGE